MNPHNWLSRVGEPPADCWRCEYCGQVDTYVAMRGRECAYEYPPCESCGQTPECAADCKGMAQALADPRVYVAGTAAPGRPKA